GLTLKVIQTRWWISGLKEGFERRPGALACLKQPSRRRLVHGQEAGDERGDGRDVGGGLGLKVRLRRRVPVGAINRHAPGALVPGGVLIDDAQDDRRHVLASREARRAIADGRS